MSHKSKVIDKTSYMRSMIRKYKIATSWPYYPIDVDKASFVIPDYLVLGFLTDNTALCLQKLAYNLNKQQTFVPAITQS